MINQSAQGLASLGRGNDSMLVHMTPREVQGLQGLAMAHGGSLTINPQTGLPEAGFLDAILPTVGGFALSPFMGPMAAGLLVGGLTAAATGDIGQGLMAGLGGFGGADLAKTFGAMGASGGIPTGAGVDVIKSGIVNELPMNVAQNAATNLGMFNAPGATATMGGIGSTVPTAVQSLSAAPTNIGPGVNSAVNAMGAAPTSSQVALAAPVSTSPYSNITKGMGEFFSDPFGKGFDAFKTAGGEPGKPLETGSALMKLAGPPVGIAMNLMEPEVPEPYVSPDKGKYRGPQGQLNLSDVWNTGLKLAVGGAVNTNPSAGAGISDLYNRPEGQTLENISQDGYGIGRLSALANAEAMNSARTLGYAEGGKINNLSEAFGVATPTADANALNLEAMPTLNLNSGESNYTNPFGLMTYGLRNAIQSQARAGNNDAKVLDGMYSLGPEGFTMYDLFSAMGRKGMNESRGMAKGGYLDGQGDGMSDSIPATIEGQQPARLADGEFVVPADVVSHIGNGSSKAGSKRLYSMLDRVRKARTGHTKQGKEIKPEKYMPA